MRAIKETKITYSANQVEDEEDIFNERRSTIQSHFCAFILASSLQIRLHNPLGNFATLRSFILEKTLNLARDDCIHDFTARRSRHE
jgi:hypothetical protein